MIGVTYTPIDVVLVESDIVQPETAVRTNAPQFSRTSTVKASIP
jgi:hypothetical protein